VAARSDLTCSPLLIWCPKKQACTDCFITAYFAPNKQNSPLIYSRRQEGGSVMLLDFVGFDQLPRSRQMTKPRTIDCEHQDSQRAACIDEHYDYCRWPNRADLQYFESEIRIALICVQLGRSSPAANRQLCFTRALTILNSLSDWIRANGGHPPLERQLAKICDQIDSWSPAKSYTDGTATTGATHASTLIDTPVECSGVASNSKDQFLA
jgi:hypothetical protein